MYLKYGNYRHALGEPVISISREPVRSPAGQWYAERVRWDIEGTISNQSGRAADLKTAIARLEAAYIDGKDLVLLLPDGRTPSNHAIYNRDCIGGTRIVQGPSYPRGDGPEHVTYRTFRVSVEGEVLLEDRPVVLSFEESISISGGGPVFGHIETRTGSPVKQLLTRQSKCTASQQGRAVGLGGYPIVPSPIWPADQVRPGTLQRRSPRRNGADYVEYEISWNYEFESAGRLSGTPHRWTSL